MRIAVAQTSNDGFNPWFVAVLVLAAFVVVAGVLLLRRWDDKDHRAARLRLQLSLAFASVLLLLGIIVTFPGDSDVRNSLLGLYGLLITAIIGLTATTYVGNGLAGFILRSRGSFANGDYIRSGDLVGGVTDQRLLHTEIETEDGDLILIPNTRMVTEPVTVMRVKRGIVVSSEVSLGYDVPSTKVTAVLKEAGAAAGLKGISALITSLGDFSVTYRVLGRLYANDDATDTVFPIIATRSLLREEILNQLHRAGIELVSPTFMNQRQLERGDRFIPVMQPPPTKAEVEASVEETLNPKTHKAREVERLREKRAELREEVESIKAQIGNGLDGQSVARAEDRRARIDQEIERLDGEIETAEQEAAEA